MTDCIKFLQNLSELYTLLMNCFSFTLSEQMYLMKLHRCYRFSKAGDQSKSKEIFIFKTSFQYLFNFGSINL